VGGRIFWVVAAVAAAGVLASGCADVVPGTPHRQAALTQPHFPNTSGSQASSSTGSSGTLPIIKTVDFTRPSGFVKARNLRIDHPIAPNYQAEFLIPQREPANGKDALAVVLYDLPAGSRPATLALQKQFIERYDTAHSVSVTDGVQPHSIGGYAGLSVVADAPPDYHFLGFYLFGTDALLEVTCQYDQRLAAIAAACGRVVGSIKVTG
jgi:hypothetical protein